LNQQAKRRQVYKAKKKSQILIRDFPAFSLGGKVGFMPFIFPLRRTMITLVHHRAALL
jgi:hypothetical protein